MTPSPVLVRPAAASDTDAIRALALDNGMFALDEMEAIDGALGGFLDGATPEEHWIVATVDDVVTGAAYWAPEPFSDRLWNLYFIAVQPDGHRRGTGTALLAHVEESLRAAGEEVARVLIVETSSVEQYAQARAFYLRSGYDQEARIRDFYGPGDDKVVFWKRLQP